MEDMEQVRQNNKRKMLAAILAAVGLVLAGVCAKLFWIGRPCDGSAVSIQAEVDREEDALILRLEEMNSGSALRGLKTETAHGVTSITSREVLVPPFHQVSNAGLTLPLEGVDRVQVFGRTVWEEGVLIDFHTQRLLSARVAYVGDAPSGPLGLSPWSRPTAF